MKSPWFVALLAGITVAVPASCWSQETAGQGAVARLDEADQLTGAAALDIYEEIWKGEHPSAVRGRAACGAASVLLHWTRREDGLAALGEGITLLEAGASSEEQKGYPWIPVELSWCHLLRTMALDEFPAKDLGTALEVLLAPGVSTTGQWREQLEDIVLWLMVAGEDATDAIEPAVLEGFAARLDALASEANPNQAGMHLAAVWLAAFADHGEGRGAVAVKHLADATGADLSCDAEGKALLLPMLRALSMEQIAAWLHEEGADAEAASWARRSVALTEECTSRLNAPPNSVRSAYVDSMFSFGALNLGQRILEREYELLRDLLGADSPATAIVENELAGTLLANGKLDQAQGHFLRVVEVLKGAGARPKPILMSAYHALVNQSLTPADAARLDALLEDQLRECQSRDPRDPIEELLLLSFLGDVSTSEEDLARSEQWFQKATALLGRFDILPLGKMPEGDREISGNVALGIYLGLVNAQLGQGHPWRADKPLQLARALLDRGSEDGDPLTFYRARYENYAGAVAFARGDPLAAERHFKKVLALLSGAPGPPLLLTGTQLALVPVLLNLGKVEEAAALGARVVDTYRAWGPSFAGCLAQSLGNLAEAEVVRDDSKEAMAHLTEAIGVLERNGKGDTEQASAIRCFRIQVELLMAEPAPGPEEIAQRLRAEADAWRSRGIDALQCQAQAAAFLHEAGRNEEAAAMTRDLIPRLRERFGEEHPWVASEMISLAAAIDRYDPGEALRLLRTLRGDLRRIEGSSPDMLEQVEEMIEWLEAADAASDSSARILLPAEAPSPSPQPEHR